MNQKYFKSKHDIQITEFDGREEVNSDFFQGELTKFVGECRNPIPIEVLVNFKIGKFTNIKNKGKVIELIDQFLLDLCKEINFK